MTCGTKQHFKTDQFWDQFWDLWKVQMKITDKRISYLLPSLKIVNCQNEPSNAKTIKQTVWVSSFTTKLNNRAFKKIQFLSKYVEAAEPAILICLRLQWPPSDDKMSKQNGSLWKQNLKTHIFKWCLNANSWLWKDKIRSWEKQLQKF